MGVLFRYIIVYGITRHGYTVTGAIDRETTYPHEMAKRQTTYSVHKEYAWKYVLIFAYARGNMMKNVWMPCHISAELRLYIDNCHMLI